ncbi:DUF6953 family protein [Bradyrhizobium diazoefficiens]|uniref:DUF6953 family protein n=1 Tax=Bradyrhizobium diazoefficiens TaxID=1355477 RepID=UPI0011776599|nr:hypothetical protein [Bradyrhizobium diazoefficiens]QLD39766.1 hypothetical protein HUW42_01340 [Bradyrhizobium diazoefficiens]
MITAEDVAQWMVEEMWRRKGRLEQAIAVEGILKKFGREFLYENKNGNLAICRGVLDAFELASGNGTVWSVSGKLWRYREQSDKPGRQQD